MTSADIFTILNGITSLSNKVAYRSFEEGSAPALPFLCFVETGTNNVMADNKVQAVITDYDIELYEDKRNSELEAAVEEALNTNDIPWNRYPEWIEDERMWQITYEVEVSE